LVSICKIFFESDIIWGIVVLDLLVPDNGRPCHFLELVASIRVCQNPLVSALPCFVRFEVLGFNPLPTYAMICDNQADRYGAVYHKRNIVKLDDIKVRKKNLSIFS